MLVVSCIPKDLEAFVLLALLAPGLTHTLDIADGVLVIGDPYDPFATKCEADILHPNVPADNGCTTGQ